MPAIKTPSSSLPASPRIGYKPLDLEKIFNNLTNGAQTNGHCMMTNGHSKPNSGSGSGTNSVSPPPMGREFSSELTQLHTIGAELRSGLIKAVEALRLVQNNDEIMRNNIETANAQTQRGISELTKVISAVQDDTNQLRAKLDTLETSNKEMRQKIAELEEKTRLTATSSPSNGSNSSTNNEGAIHSPVITAPPPSAQPQAPPRQIVTTVAESTNNSESSSKNQQYYHISAMKHRQNFLNFLTAEVNFCRTIAKMCQQQQQTAALLASRRANASLNSPKQSDNFSIFPPSLWQIYRVHAEFLTQLEARMSKWGQWSCVGDVFLRLLDNKVSHFGDIYKLYANELLSIFGAGGSPVCAPLLLPFRRLADYVAFLETTRQSLDHDHPDLYNVAKSTDKLRGLITRLNEHQLRFLIVADNVAPVGSGTAMEHNNSQMTSSCMPKIVTLNKDKTITINNGSATIARTRYTQNSKNNGKIALNGDLKKNGLKSASSNNVMMLKSRSHGDLYVAAHNEAEGAICSTSCYPEQHNLSFNNGNAINNSTCSDDEDEDGDEGGLVSPVNYTDLFEGDIQLTTRSLPRNRLNHHQQSQSKQAQGVGHHQRNLSDDSQVVLDCWTSKAPNTATTFASTTTSVSRPCSATTSSATTTHGGEVIMAEIQAFPPLPHRSCETTNPSRYHHSHMSATNNPREKVAIFVSATPIVNNGTISSGSSGSGGSTTGKSTYQPLESVKQSLLNLFNGYKKRKRNTLHGNGLVSPVTNGVNAPQIRIISPPSSLIDKHQLPYSVLANSNFHVDIRNEVRGRPSCNGASNCVMPGLQQVVASSTNGGSTDSSNIASPPSSPTAIVTVPSLNGTNSSQKKSPILNGTT